MNDEEIEREREDKTRLNFRSLLVGATLAVLLGAGAFGGYMFLSRPTMEISDVTLRFDSSTLSGVIEVTFHGRGTLQILNMTLTGQGNVYSDLHPQHIRFIFIRFPLTVELPAKINLDVFMYNYPPPEPSAVTVTIQGAWTYHHISFPVAISQTVPLKWCALNSTIQSFLDCWTKPYNLPVLISSLYAIYWASIPRILKTDWPLSPQRVQRTFLSRTGIP